MNSYEVLGAVVIVGVIAVWGVWKNTTAENNSYQEFVQRERDLEVKIRDLEKTIKQIDNSAIQESSESFQSLKNEISKSDLKIKDLEEQIAHYQEHIQRISSSQSHLEKKSYPKRHDVYIHQVGPLTVELIQTKHLDITKQRDSEKNELPKGTQKLLNKTREQLKDHVKTQLDGLSK